MKKSIHKTTSSTQTEAFGEKIAKRLKGKKVFLFGDLGVGKTTFLCGLARGLGVFSKIKSPTFVGEHIHKISKSE
ncbi:tRNA (adenosine(37)-N6)-threonylcarbamoyltransferase complex ATPase subunit type 1 TsaE, partial [Candidatus Babeliales bacterium]|nr:tRNA (adenosine(37)-N6)-threonylcarbamoyltransferase complex ATPase subunit type 1 TsaE [Candidatus Babeliales bacterium]